MGLSFQILQPCLDAGSRYPVVQSVGAISLEAEVEGRVAVAFAAYPVAVFHPSFWLNMYSTSTNRSQISLPGCNSNLYK